VTPWNYYSNTALTPFLPDDDLFYDYYFSILGKALYEATGKTTGVQVQAQRSLVTVRRRQLPAAPVEFTVTLADPELRDGSLAYELRDRQGRVLHKASSAVPLAASRFTPPLPRLPQGTYMVDVWALQRGAVLDWASAGLVVTDTKYLEAIQPAQEFFARTEPIRGGRTIRDASTARAGHERRVVGHLRPPDRGHASRQNRRRVRVPSVVAPLSRAYRLVAKVQEKDFVVDRAETWVACLPTPSTTTSF